VYWDNPRGSGPGNSETTYGKLPCMEIGVAYPQIELRGNPDAVGTFGRAVEDLGFDHLLAYDHVVGAVHAGRSPQLTGPYTERDPFHDPFVLFAYWLALPNESLLLPGSWFCRSARRHS
jgi:hypothetical protein